MKPRDAHHLKLALLSAKGSDGASLLTDTEASNRGLAIWEEAAAIGFELKLQGWPTPSGHLYPAYELNDPRYDLDTIGFGSPDSFAVNAPGISHGDLLKLGRALETRRRFLPTRWSKDLKDNLLDTQKHLDTIEELCWLDRWQEPTGVVGPVPNSATGKDVDWQLISNDTPLRLEVKNWRAEWTGILDHTHRGRRYESRFASFEQKFWRDSNTALNVGCVSTYFPTDADLAKTAAEFLANHHEIDAFVIHSSHVDGDRGVHIEVMANPAIKNRLLSLLKPLPTEELSRAVRVRHLQRNSAGGVINSIDEGLKKLGLI